MQLQPHVISWCKNRFYASKKGGIRRGGRVSAQGAVHMAAALAGCRKPQSALAGPFLSFLTQMGADKAPLPF